MERPATTKVRCPKCRSRDLSLVEIGTWTSQWDVRNGALDRVSGTHEPDSMLRVEATCTACNHHWRIRRAIQITDVVQEIGTR